MENSRNDYSQKMLEDAAKFQELQQKKEEDARQFEEAIAEAIETHNQTINEMMDRHHQQMEGQTAMTEQMKREKQNKLRDNKETIDQIKDDAAEEKKDIEQKNQKNLNQVHEMSLKSKAELQLTNNKLTDLGYDIESLKRQLQDKEIQFKIQEDATQKLNLKI